MGINSYELYDGSKSLNQKEEALKKAIALNPENDEAYYKLVEFYRETDSLNQEEDALKKAIALNHENDEAYCKLGVLYREERAYAQAEEAIKKAIALNPENDEAYCELVKLSRDIGDLAQAEDALKKVIVRNSGLRALYGILALLYQEMKKDDIAQKYFQKVTMMFGYYKPITISNYHKLKKILDKRGIKLVCVQYPVRNIEPLKKIFIGQNDIVFVDNEKIFKDAIKKEGYKEYFEDTFGGDFGHCTPKGNRLLAENIANTLKKYHNANSECFKSGEAECAEEKF